MATFTDVYKQELKSNLEKPKKKKKEEDLEENKFKIFV